MSKKVGIRLSWIDYHRNISREMRGRWEEYGVKTPSALSRFPPSLSLYDITTHEQRLKLDEAIERITGKWCDEGVNDLTDEQLIEILDRVLKEMAKERGKKLEKEIGAMVA